MRSASSMPLARPVPVVDQIMRQPDRLAFLGAVGAAGQHHAPSRARRRSAAAAAPSRRRRGRCRGCLPAARNRPSVRRRGHAQRRQARARRRPPRRAAPPPPAPCRTGSRRTRDATCANAATPSATSRSVSSPRSRPAEKCSPSPCSTTALMSSGSAGRTPRCRGWWCRRARCASAAATGAGSRRRPAARPTSEAGRLGRECRLLLDGFAMRSGSGGGSSASRSSLRGPSQAAPAPGSESGAATAPRARRSAPPPSRGRRSRSRGCG